jgi:hypothetical protein
MPGQGTARYLQMLLIVLIAGEPASDRLHTRIVRPSLTLHSHIPPLQASKLWTTSTRSAQRWRG